MTEYRITIGQKRGNSDQSTSRTRSKLELLKASVLTLLALSAVVGIFLAALVVGSIIASLLLILIAAFIVILLIRRVLRSFRR